MIYYDEIVLHAQGVDSFGDPIPGETLDVPVPAEVWPISNVETDKSQATGAGVPKTVYRVATPFDMETRGDLIPSGWTGTPSWSILYRGGPMETPAGFERHAISGRLDHYEFVAEDFGSTS